MNVQLRQRDQRLRVVGGGRVDLTLQNCCTQTATGGLHVPQLCMKSPQWTSLGLAAWWYVQDHVFGYMKLAVWPVYFHPLQVKRHEETLVYVKAR